MHLYHLFKLILTQKLYTIMRIVLNTPLVAIKFEIYER